MQQKGNDEFHLRELADRLQFKVDKVEDRFTLCRTSDVVQPVCEKDLTLSEAKEFLETWKLRGFHGG